MTEDERGLFEEFVRVRKADNITPEKAPVPGIAPRTLRRYIVDGEVPTRLEDDTKGAMARFLASRGDHRFAQFETAAEDPPTNGASDLARQIDEINRGPGTRAEKDRAIETIAAAYRSEALRDAEKSAIERGAAGRLEAAKAPNRNLPGGVSSEELGLAMRALRAWLALHPDEDDGGPSNGGPEPPDPPPLDV